MSYEKVYIPKKINDKNKYNPTQWINVYHYYDKKTLKKKYNIEYNLPIVVSSKYIRKQTLYKDVAKSKCDKLYDYYKILKPKFDQHEKCAVERTRVRFNNNIFYDKNAKPFFKENEEIVKFGWSQS